jgi:hypothetical protein
MIQRTCGELFLAQCRTKYLERWWLSAGVRQPSTAQRDWRSESTSTCSCGAECGEGARCRRPDWKRRHCTRKEFVCLFQEWCHNCWVPPWPRLWILCLCLCVWLSSTQPSFFLPSPFHIVDRHGKKGQGRHDANVSRARTGGRIQKTHCPTRCGKEASSGESPSRCPTRCCISHSTQP